MIQNINLYEIILLKRNIPLPFRVMKNIFYGCFLLLGIVTIILILIHLKDVHDLKTLETAQLDASSKLREKTAKIAPRADREQTISQLEAKEKILKKNQDIVKKLSEINQTGSLGFSRALIALSNSIQEGLWLTHFEFSEGGNYFLLSGKTIDPNLLTKFISLLSKEVVFSGKSLEVFKMESDPKDSALQFTLKSYEKK